MGGLGEKGKDNKKHKVAVTKQSQVSQVQHKEYSQKYCNNYVMSNYYAVHLKLI